VSQLIQADELATALAAGTAVVVDCRYQLGDSDAGYQAYGRGHIPGAYYVNLAKELAGTGPATAGRHPLPQPADFAQLLGRIGADQGRPIIAYDDAGGMMAARFWWLCRWLGHDQVMLLDGGWQAWLAAGGSVSTDVPTDHDGAPEYRLQKDMTIAAQQLQKALTQERCLLIDARAEQRYCGESEPMDPLAGHICGAVNHPCTNNLDADGKFLSPNRLLEMFTALLGDTPAQQVVHSCGSGVTACHNMLAMELAGLGGSRLFAPSWSGWIAQPGNLYQQGSGVDSPQLRVGAD